MSVVIAIDPGVNGAIAALTNGQLTVIDMPIVGKYVDTDTVRDFIASFHGHDKTIVMEELQARSHQANPARLIDMGIRWGQLYEVSTLYPYATIRPQQWADTVGRPSGLTYAERKKWSLTRARELWPDQRQELFSLAKHDGRAEAALMAWANTPARLRDAA